MVSGAKYWAQSDDSVGDVFEIVHYIGRKVTQPGFVFEDGHGDIHILSDHEVVVAPEGMFDERA